MTRLRGDAQEILLERQLHLGCGGMGLDEQWSGVRLRALCVFLVPRAVYMLLAEALRGPGADGLEQGLTAQRGLRGRPFR